MLLSKSLLQLSGKLTVDAGIVVVDKINGKVMVSKDITTLLAGNLIELPDAICLRLFDPGARDFANYLIHNESIKSRYQILSGDNLGQKSYLIFDIVSKNLVFLESNDLKEYGNGGFVYRDCEYFEKVLLNTTVLDFSGNSRETVDWFLGYMRDTAGFTISQSNKLFGSRVVIDKKNKIISLYNSNNVEDRLIYHTENFSRFMADIMGKILTV